MDLEDNQPNEDSTTPSLTNTKSKKRKGRGATRLPDVIKDRSSGVRKKIHYDDKGRPIGINRAKFSSYLGVLARTMIPLSHKNWFDVPDEIKEKLWSSVKAAFDVDLRSEKNVLSSIGSSFRTFKKTLTKYIYAHKSDPIILSKPPEAYSFLEQKEWDSFVKERLTPEFEKFHGLQLKRRKCNIYDHRLSRKGYAGLEEELVNNSEELVVSLDRSFTWKKARQNKKGEYDNIKIMEKVADIDEIAKQVEGGTLQIEGSNDILTMALGNAERGGKVRGVGGKVTPTMYFHVPRRGNHSRCEEKQMSLEKIVSEMQVQLDILTQHTPHTPQSDNMGSNTFRSDNVGSPKNNNFAIGNWGRTKDNNSPTNPIPNVKKGKQCKLAVESINNIVAHGTVYEKIGPNELLHTMPLGEDNLRVSIEVVKVGEAFLPIPIPGEVATVGEAVGYHIAWPKKLILFAPEVGGMIGNEVMSKHQDLENNLELPNVKKSKQCMLAVGSVNNIVAHGTMYWKSGPDEPLHKVPLGEENMRVSIDVVKVKDAFLPIPIPGVAVTVGDAIGCHVAWPNNLIFFAPEVASKKPNMDGNEATLEKQNWEKNLDSVKVKKSKQCKLAMGDFNNIVALGKVYEKSGPNELLHTVPLGKSNMRVSIDVAKVPTALLPIPIPGDATTVGDAVGYHVAWPKNLIWILNEGASKKLGVIGNERVEKHHGVVGRGVVEDEVTSKNVDWEKNLKCIELFATLVEHTEVAIMIPLEKDIFGMEVDVNLQKVDMEYICHMKQVSATCIMLYIRQLYLGIKASNMDTRFAFVNPCILSDKYKDGETSKPVMLASRLEEVRSDQLVLVPCNIGAHWVLCVLQLSSSTVYLMDSVNKEFNLHLQLLIKAAFKIYDSNKGKRRGSINWITIECPKQLSNVECGFYVMKYMKELIRDETILRRGNFNGKKTYTKAEIDEVRSSG